MRQRLARDSRRPRPAALRIGIAALTLSLVAACGAHAEPTNEREEPLDSGRDSGEFVPQFYTRVVTGPLMNKSVCYVCRNGRRPVVMVLMQQVGPELRPLLKNIDRLVDRNRAAGLRSFGVVLTEAPSQALPHVQTFAFDNKVAMPLAVATTAVGAASCQNVHPDAAVTVVLYRERKVVETFAFRSDELKVEGFRPVIERVRSFVGDEGSD